MTGLSLDGVWFEKSQEQLLSAIDARVTRGQVCHQPIRWTIPDLASVLKDEQGIPWALDEFWQPIPGEIYALPQNIPEGCCCRATALAVICISGETDASADQPGARALLLFLWQSPGVAGSPLQPENPGSPADHFDPGGLAKRAPVCFLATIDQMFFKKQERAPHPAQVRGGVRVGGDQIRASAVSGKSFSSSLLTLQTK